MNSSALVEVVIPTYNQADFLRVALQSVIAQDHQNWVATVVNNLSSDHTHNVVHELADSRIRIVDFANHGVIAASRNLAIRDSRADFIAFLDSDDWWQPTKLSTCLGRLNDGVDLVCHAEEWRSDHSSRIVRYGPQHRMEYEAMLRGGNCLSTSAIVGRTRVFQQLGGFSFSDSVWSRQRITTCGCEFSPASARLFAWRHHLRVYTRRISANLA